MASKYYARLRLRIVIATLCFSLIPLFALGITIHYQFSKAYWSKIEDGLRTVVENERSSIELFFDERISQLMTVANTQTLEALQDEDYLKTVFDTMQARSKSYIDIGVIDQQGNHLAYVGPHHEQLISVNYSHEDWFQAVMTSRVYVSDVFLGFRKIPHFIIAVTRVEKNRSWIVRATINSDVIDNIVRKAQMGRKGDAYLINRQNILQTTPRFSGKLFERPTSPDFSKTVGAVFEQFSLDSQKALFAVSPLSVPKWVLVVKQDPNEEMAPLIAAQFSGWIILAGGVFLVIIGTVFTSRAITGELIRLEHDKAKSDDLIVQSSKMAALGKMAAGIAHEINNPLAIIGEKAGWMRDLLDKEDVRQSENFKEFEDCIKKIERQVERSRTITHRLLRFGRRMEPTQELIDINQVLAETTTFLENEAHYREIRMEAEYAENIPRITTDSAQLQQVFLNIINNGIDAVGKNGVIKIRTDYVGGSDPVVRIVISDDGPGMPKDVLSRIFDPFFTTKSPSEGTGLGLSISFSIMEKLGGRITVESEEGKGTSFFIFLPAK